MDIQSVFDLSPAEKLQLVEDLWDDLASNPANVPMPDWHKQELEKRKANLKTNPPLKSTWDEMCARIRARYDAS